MPPIPGILLLLSLTLSSAAPEGALLLIERRSPADREVLLSRGVPVVKEYGDVLLAYGAPGPLLPAMEADGFTARVLDRPRGGETYHLLGLREGFVPPLGIDCGRTVWAEGNQLIVKTPSPGRPPCADSPAFRWSPLDLETLSPAKPARRLAPAREAQPLVRRVVEELSDQAVAGALEEVVGWAGSRYSYNAGCAAAAQAAQEAFAAAGLTSQLQDWSSKFPPNVVAEIPGETHPEDVLIVVAHLDDMPATPPAPGADDNASGSAMVLALARAMAPYRFASTVKFLLVTGEEQGLVGAKYYAADAERRGEAIRAVLNADMIAWEGDGRPEAEDLDINYDADSEWLALLMVEAAGLYATGGPVNAFYCPGMVYSDHAAFWDRGWSAVCGITDNEGFCRQKGTYPYYHTHNDTIANCGDLAFFAGASRTYLATLAHLAVPLGRRDDPEGHLRPLERP